MRRCAPLLVASLLSFDAYAEDVGAIVKRSLEHFAFRRGGTEMEARMVLENKSGDRRERRMQLKIRSDGGLARTLVRFLSPPDVAGTKFLLIEHDAREDDQFLYLPALRRVRRIAPGQKLQSFMGSDFTYSDLEGRDVEEAAYALQGEESIDGKAHWRIEAIPKRGSASAYRRVALWVRKDDHVGVRTKFFDHDGKHVKTLSVIRVSREDGSLVVRESKMENVSTGHKTTLFIDKIVFRDDFPAEDFTATQLEQG